MVKRGRSPEAARKAAQIGRSATRAYFAALAVIATLAIGSFVVTYSAILKERTSVTLVSLSAEQRALAHYLGFLVSRYSQVAETAEGAGLRAEMEITRQTMLDNHRTLIEGNPAFDLAAEQKPEVLDRFFAPPHNLDFKIRRFLSLVGLIVDAPRDRVNDDLVFQAITLARQDLPNSLRVLTNTYKASTSEGIGQIGQVSLFVLLLNLMSVVLIGVLLMRPMVARIVDRSRKLAETESALEHTLFHDELTGLPNRAGAMALFNQHYHPKHEGGVAAIHLDITNFRSINDAHGQSVGDEVLRIVARRLENCVRGSDFVARISGNDFAVIFPEISAEQNVAEVSRRISEALSTPITIDDATVTLTCAMGLAYDESRKTNYERIMMNADIAHREASTDATDNVRSFDEQMRSQVEQRDAVLRQLSDGIKRDQIEPYFQPQIAADTGAVTGFEALVRWRHPDRGVLSPFHFLDLAETEGMGDAIHDIVVEKSLSALKSWDAAGYTVPHIGINFSSGQLRDPKIVDKINWVVDSSGLEPARVAIEVLETVMVDSDDDMVVQNLHRLAEAGFQLDLDDFGTGHASISNIRRFGVDRVKIDRAFVSGIDSDEPLRKMTLAMVKMARGIGIDALAEGVETAAEQRVLTEMGCTHLQGFGIGRPMPLDDTLVWLAKHRANERTRARQSAAS
ncbi:MAG: bifunctional diguanylate cyclase/phosphodiesterase [Pseudomonadota bacterium]